MRVKPGAYLVAYTTASGSGSVEMFVNKRADYEAFKTAIKQQIATQTTEPFVITTISFVARKGWL